VPGLPCGSLPIAFRRLLQPTRSATFRFCRHFVFSLLPCPLIHGSGVLIGWAVKKPGSEWDDSARWPRGDCGEEIGAPERVCYTIVKARSEYNGNAGHLVDHSSCRKVNRSYQEMWNWYFYTLLVQYLTALE